MARGCSQERGQGEGRHGRGAAQRAGLPAASGGCALRGMRSAAPPSRGGLGRASSWRRACKRALKPTKNMKAAKNAYRKGHAPSLNSRQGSAFSASRSGVGSITGRCRRAGEPPCSACGARGGPAREHAAAVSGGGNATVAKSAGAQTGIRCAQRSPPLPPLGAAGPELSALKTGCAAPARGQRGAGGRQVLNASCRRRGGTARHAPRTHPSQLPPYCSGTADG